jgi:hypothetical protein
MSPAPRSARLPSGGSSAASASSPMPIPAHFAGVLVSRVHAAQRSGVSRVITAQEWPRFLGVDLLALGGDRVRSRLRRPGQYLNEADNGNHNKGDDENAHSAQRWAEQDE